MTATIERLRKDIDSGATRDKVSGPDPAVAPLGADDEAAGAPVSPARTALDRSHATDAEPRSLEDGGTWFYASALVLVAAILITTVLTMMR